MNLEYYERVLGVIEPRTLVSQPVCIVGCGSGGGIIAEELCRLGVSLALVDKPGERLEMHNLVRHVLGPARLGEEKAHALRDHLRGHFGTGAGARASIEAATIDCVTEPERIHKYLVEFRPQILVAATDTEESKFALDAAARSLRLPVVGGGVYDGGVGGEAYITEPGGPCYGCIFEALQGAGAERHPAAKSDYSSPHTPEAQPTAALRIDIAQIAGLCVRLVLRRLLSPRDDAFGVPAETNVIVFANRTVRDVFSRPLTASFHRISPSPRCLWCAPRSMAAERAPAPQTP